MTRTATPAREAQVPPSGFLRWCKFNFVGGIGIVVQFGVLFLLKGVLHFNYLVATATAVEAAVLHNFVWHRGGAARCPDSCVSISATEPSPSWAIWH